MGSDSADLTWGGRKRKMRVGLIRNRKAIQKKIKQLKRLIPGGNQMENAETLFRKTAIYIYMLEWQVSALRNMYALYAVDNIHSEDSTVGSIKDQK